MKIHIFIDAENVPYTNALESYEVLSESGDYVCDVVGKEETLPQAYLKRRSPTFRIHNCDYGKNSADLSMTVLIAKAVYEEPDTDILAIISNDRDFAPIIQLAVEKRKQVLLLGMAAQSKGLTELFERMGIDMNFVTLGIIDGESQSESIKVDDLPNGLYEYFRKHYKGSTIFVKRGEKLVEMPFVEGMPVNVFLDLMRRCKIWTRAQKVEEEVGSLFLKVVDNQVHFLDRYGYAIFDKPEFKQFPEDLQEFFMSNYEGETIFVKHNGNFVELPFINGMHLGRFIQMLRSVGIWSRSQKLRVTLEKLDELGLQLKNDHVCYGD